MELPVTDAALIAQCRTEFERASSSGAADANGEGLRLVWALVHSRSIAKDVPRGLALADELLDKPDADSTYKRELVYLWAVGKYRNGSLLEARRQLDELLKVSPESHQAKSLKQAVEDQIIKEGLIGVGVVGGFLGVAGLVVGALLARR